MAIAPEMLIPMIRVRDVPASIAFYAKLGFHVRSTNAPPGGAVPSWAMLEGQAARLMVTSQGEPPVAEQQAALLSLDYNDIGEAHAMARETGLGPEPIAYPFFSPRGQFRMTDPDGYVLMVSST